MTVSIIAVDCGAESGRVILGRLDGFDLRLEEIHRFANGGRFIDGTFRWDWQRLVTGMMTGVGKALQVAPDAVSVGIDTWGVDFGLLDETGALLDEPVHYRDERSNRVAETLDARVGSTDRFQATGIRQMSINTLDQLFALATEHPAVVQRARRLLFAPDLLAWELTGIASNERSIASTSSCYAPGAEQVARDLLQRLGLPTGIFPDTCASGTVIGPLQASAVTACGLSSVPGLEVMTSGGHDTAAAVAAVPSAEQELCYISSGTWSLLGTVIDSPRLDAEVRRAEFTNEVAWDGRIRLLKNIMGLWIVQECRRHFADSGRAYDYGQLTELAAAAIDPVQALAVNDSRFLGPGTDADPMPARVQGWYAERGLAVPADDGAIVRAVLCGLAQAYAEGFRAVQDLTGASFAAVYVIGGGCRNGLLCQMTADACGVPVIAGPVEATAIGNILIQAVGRGLLTAGDLPGVVASVEDLCRFEPT